MSYLNLDKIPPQLLQGEISKFPKIVTRIEYMWGFKELNDYLSSLLVSTRVDREGFPPEVFKQLVKISEAHKNTYPQLVDNSVYFTFS